MRSGLAAEFTGAGDLMLAVQRLRQNGYRDLDAFTPHPVGGLEEELGLGRSRLNWLVFPIGLGGALGAFLLQAWCNGYDYPINVGGRPPFAWVTNIPITFETGVLATSVSAFFALFWVLGLPNLTFPLFKIDGFERASVDRFWLAIGDGDPALDAQKTSQELLQLGAVRTVPFGAFAEVAR